VRRPFLSHGLLQGLAAGGVAIALAAGVIAWLNAELSALTSSYAYEIKIIFPSPEALLATVSAVVALGIAGAWISVSRELRRFSRSA
jgi:cell division transport system permease protein